MRMIDIKFAVMLNMPSLVIVETSVGDRHHVNNNQQYH